METKIMLVDDHGIVRQGLRLLIEQEDDLVVVAEVSDGREAVQLARKLLPDIVLMDVSMPHLNGIDAGVQIMSEHPSIKILLLSAFCERGFVTEALQANVAGYVLKDSAVEELVHAIRVVLADEQYLSPKVAGIVVSEYRSKCLSNSPYLPPNQISSKERELIQILAEGHSAKEAARTLHISIKTVDARRRVLMEKLSVNSLANLTKYAIREGLTTVD